MLYELIDKDFSFEDHRGELVQLVHDGYTQINVLVTKQGVTRGQHYHKISTEAFYVVSGKVELTFEREAEKETVVFNKGQFFKIFPYVKHTMNFLEETVMVGMYDIPVENDKGEKDMYND